jgi:large subunit ribosomal protein L18e
MFAWYLQLYSFLARRTGANFNAIVLKRLVQSRTNRPPIGLNRLIRYMKDRTDKIAVIVGTITDDVRLDGHRIPALRVCALRVTEGARARIVKAGGEVITFDQLALKAPTGAGTILLRARRTARKANRFFGNPGAPGSKTQPRIASKGRKFERARGRRRSSGFKV